MLSVDTETTGVDVEAARVVSAAAILVNSGGAKARTWLADPGVEIPEGATAVHGITTEHARAEGAPAAAVVEEIVTALAEAVTAGIPLVGHNVVYDLTIIDREARRHLGTGLLDVFGQHAQLAVIDTMVLDRYTAPFRRRVSETQGPYQLRTTAETYGFEWDDEAAHGAKYDALMAARIAWKIGAIAAAPRASRPEWVQKLRTNRFGALSGMTVMELHQSQILWAAEDAAGFQQWLRTKAPDGKRDPAAVIDGTWPLRPLPVPAEEATV
jgi:DNA polymerase-3 subunit epsilon